MKDKICVCVDGSYMLHYTISGAFRKFLNTSTEAEPFNDVNAIDQENLPDILNSIDFKRELRNYVMKRLETIHYILKSNLGEELDPVRDADIFFVLDDKLSHSFRKQLYPAYKSQRKLIKKAYDTDKVRDYVLNVLFPELNLVEQYGYNMVKVDGAEGDDVVYSIITNFGKDYKQRVLIASDKDYLQMEDVVQYDMAGQEVVRNVKYADAPLTAKEFLLWKIIFGDKSDNINHIFTGCGEKKTLDLVHNKEELKKIIKENQDAAKQFKLNRELIDFKYIPQSIHDAVAKKVNVILEKIKEQDENMLKLDLEDCIIL